MFTGIIETLGRIMKVEKIGSNLQFTISSTITAELKIDQSVAHNGICLTVVLIDGSNYVVTAIDETVKRTTIGQWKEGDAVNLERGMKWNARLDGHIVQGHVDQTAVCTDIRDADGSFIFSFEYNPAAGNVTIAKGSITVNGVSLTVVDSADGFFSVAIIPFTLENTTFAELTVGSHVNLEFDVIGKYVARLMQR